MLSRSEILRAADEAEARAAALDDEALKCRQYAAELRRLAEKAPSGLTMRGKRSMVDSNMEASDLAGLPENVRTSANRARKSPELRKLLATAGLTDEGVAKIIGVKRSTANAYVTGRLSMPRRAAEKIATKHPGVPVSAWPKLGE